MIQKKIRCIAEIDIIHGTITDFHGTQGRAILISLIIQIEDIAI